MFMDLPADLILLLIDQYFSKNTRGCLAKTNILFKNYVYDYLFDDIYKYPNKQITLHTPIFAEFNLTKPIWTHIESESTKGVPRFYFYNNERLLFNKTEATICYTFSCTFKELISMENFACQEKGLYRFSTGIAREKIEGVCINENACFRFFKNQNHKLDVQSQDCLPFCSVF